MSDHDHDHSHGAPPSLYHRSDRTSAHNAELAERVAKIESLLLEKGLVVKDALEKIVDLYEHDLGPMNGAKVVARAWVDPAFKTRLLTDATSAIAAAGNSESGPACRRPRARRSRATRSASCGDDRSDGALEAE